MALHTEMECDAQFCGDDRSTNRTMSDIWGLVPVLALTPHATLSTFLQPRQLHGWHAPYMGLGFEAINCKVIRLFHLFVVVL